jgi:hypothetical protein
LRSGCVHGWPTIWLERLVLPKRLQFVSQRGGIFGYTPPDLRKRWNPTSGIVQVKPGALIIDLLAAWLAAWMIIAMSRAAWSLALRRRPGATDLVVGMAVLLLGAAAGSMRLTDFRKASALDSQSCRMIYDPVMPAALQDLLPESWQRPFQCAVSVHGRGPTNDQIKCIARLSYLWGVSLEDLSEDSDLTPLRRLTALDYVSVYGQGIPDEAIVDALQSVQLVTVGLGGCEVGPRTIGRLSQLKRLTDLCCNECQIENPAFIQSLDRLYILTIRDSTLIHGLTGCAPWPKQLRGIELDGTRLCPDDVEILSQATGLQVLDIRNTGLAQAQIAQLKRALPNTWIVHDQHPKNAFQLSARSCACL